MPGAASGIGYSYREAERIEVDPAVVLGQHLSDVTGPPRESMVTDRAADGCGMATVTEIGGIRLIIISMMQPTAANEVMKGRIESPAISIPMQI